MPKPAITFLLPGDNFSGGVRVTAVMGNLLLERGYRVRVLHPTRSRQFWLNPSALFAPLRPEKRGWLHTFAGPVASYGNINRLRFTPGEVVIGVGTYMIPDLQKLRASTGIVKVRYNHGLPARMTPAYRAAWSLRLPTITVSPTLVQPLEQLSGEPVRAVIPNGIDPGQYFPVPGIPRDAIGTIFSVHPNKAPDDIIRLLQRIGEQLPGTPRVVFSTEPCPPALAGCQYERTPPVRRVRELYSRALIWLLASHTEGLPGPVLEAMACGAVVISTDNEGSLAVIRDGENGLLVPRGDIGAFMNRIHVTLGDAALRERLVRAGFLTAAQFTWQAAADRMEAFLATLADAPATGRS